MVQNANAYCFTGFDGGEQAGITVKKEYQTVRLVPIVPPRLTISAITPLREAIYTSFLAFCSLPD